MGYRKLAEYVDVLLKMDESHFVAKSKAHETYDALIKKIKIEIEKAMNKQMLINPNI